MPPLFRETRNNTELLPPPGWRPLSVHAHAITFHRAQMEVTSLNGIANGIPNGLPDSPSQEELERELPAVSDGQVPLAELVSRMVQAIYAELTELAET